MFILREKLTLHIEYIDTTRCAVIREHAFSNQLILKEFCAEAPIGQKPKLRSLHLACKTGFLSELFDNFHPQTGNFWDLQPSFCFENDGHFWIHVVSKNDPTVISSCWRLNANDEDQITAQLIKVVVLGNLSRKPIELCFEALDEAVSILPGNKQKELLSFSPEKAELQLEVLKYVFDKNTRKNLVIAPGHTKVYITDNLLHFEYNITQLDQKYLSDDSPHHTIQTIQFCDSSASVPKTEDDIQVISSEIVAFDESNHDGTAHLDVSVFQNIHNSDDINKDKMPHWVFSDIASTLGSSFEPIQNSNQTFKLEPVKISCPSIYAIHQAIAKSEKITSDIACKALEETEERLGSSLLPGMLYLLHKYFPELDEEFKLNILILASSEDYEPLTFAILKNIYKKQHNDTMLLSLIERQLHATHYNQHRYIQLELEYIDILSLQLSMFNMALRRLNQLKPYIMQSTCKEEHIQFALAYHHAESTGIAIQYLRQWMKSAETPNLSAAYGLELAQLMVDHNEPIQSIIVVCQQILEADPMATQALELMAQCFESSNQLDDASDVWQDCFEQSIRKWEIAQLRTQVSPTKENLDTQELLRKRAIRLAVSLEKSLSQIERPQMSCLVYQQHLRLEPDSIRTLSGLLKNLEQLKSYGEMAIACQIFLQSNLGKLKLNDELSIRLTLHNIYDCELNRPEEALEQLKIAKSLAELDPRVISTELERCRKRGLKEEQISLRLALIDVLPPKEAAEQTIELIRLYESLGSPQNKILDALRKANNRVPNHPQILLELRTYLRKAGQTFELAAVLEKLAKITLDLQVRKNILLEASEVQENLGNHKISQALYHEAQLCSPINPDNKTEFIPKSFAHNFSTPFEQTNDQLSSLSSIILTSRSLSVVEDYDMLKDKANESKSNSPSSVNVWDSLFSASEHSEGDNPEFDENATTHLQLKKDNADNSSPSIKTQIVEARLRGNPHDLLDRLLQSLSDIPEKDQPPRILQEIGCIYLYDCNDPETAKTYLERASSMDKAIASGEQTLNALESIYQSLGLYRELSEVYIKKCKILPIPSERQKYEIRLAQLHYEHLHETKLAIETLKKLLEKNPNNENALQLLAQIYIDSQEYNDATDVLEIVKDQLNPSSKAMAQLILRLIALNLEIGKTDIAKKYMLDLLEFNDYVDKLAIIELYKRTCREHDEWEDLLSILNREMAYYLKIPLKSFQIQDYLKNPFADHTRNITHTLREYADVLYQKMNNTDLAARIYHELAFQNPDDDYSRNALFEIAEARPDDKIISFIFDAYSSQGMSLPYFLELKQSVENHAPIQEISEISNMFRQQLDVRTLNYFLPLLSFVETHFLSHPSDHEKAKE